MKVKMVHHVPEILLLTICLTWHSRFITLMTPGPIYFLTPRKCGIFGVCCEAIPRQINYLVDESVDIGKGSNSIISKLHHFFHTFGLGEQLVTLHADNCSGENKNNMMLQYLMWRCMVGLHKEIEIAFLVVGHTKFAPDWCFGLLKRKFRREKVGCLADIELLTHQLQSIFPSCVVHKQERYWYQPMIGRLTYHSTSRHCEILNRTITSGSQVLHQVLSL